MGRTPEIDWEAGSFVIDQITSAVRAVGDRTAVIADGDALTYRELMARASTIAACIAKRTAGEAEPLVAVYLPKSVDLIATLVACQIAGAHYLPLDAKYPTRRLEFMLQDACPALLLTDSATASAANELSDVVPQLLVDALDEPCARCKPRRARPAPGYVIYTSGSTGRPKGVSMGGNALANLIHWQATLTDLPCGATTGQFAPLSFDVSFQEIFSTLCTGGTLVLFSDGQRVDPFELLAEIGRHDIARVFLPFVALQQLARTAVAAGEFPVSLREIHTAGEQLVVSGELRAFFSKLPQCRLFNQYGPSETHVVACHELPRAVDEWGRLPPIGKALPNVELHVLDDHRRAVAAGVVGELYVGGRALADGYLGRPELTAERFPTVALDHPKRLYRTGDVVSLDRTGNIHFKGRVDQQIKVRGHRVEPGELESVIADLPGVAEAVVLFDPDDSASGSLSAFVRGSGASDGLSDSVMAHLRRTVPDYMVPAHVVPVERFPMTPSGKVDRRSLLPEKGRNDRANSGGAIEPSGVRGGVRGSVLDHWRAVLNDPALGGDDNLFDRGATSLMVPEFQRFLLASTGRRMPAVRIFQHPTVNAISTFLDAATSSTDSLPSLSPDRAGSALQALRDRTRGTVRL